MRWALREDPGCDWPLAPQTGLGLEIQLAHGCHPAAPNLWLRCRGTAACLACSLLGKTAAVGRRPWGWVLGLPPRLPNLEQKGCLAQVDGQCQDSDLAGWGKGQCLGLGRPAGWLLCPHQVPTHSWTCRRTRGATCLLCPRARAGGSPSGESGLCFLFPGVGIGAQLHTGPQRRSCRPSRSPRPGQTL